MLCGELLLKFSMMHHSIGVGRGGGGGGRRAGGGGRGGGRGARPPNNLRGGPIYALDPQ